MVGAPAAADAVARARRLALPVGLHLVLVDGEPVSPAGEVPAITGRDGRFLHDEVRAGIRFFLHPGARRQLAAEIRAQFAAFRATGLVLDHVNGHKHVQLHPTVTRLVVEIGREFGMRAMRLPDEPVDPLRRAFPEESYRPPAYGLAVAALRRRLRRAGLLANDQVFGLAWSGAMVEDRILALLPHLPDGLSEIYAHPATASGTVPGYRHADELAALVSPAVRERIRELGIGLTSFAAAARA
jgi:hopanoid biosynthesis associated protein HpnK